MPKLSVKYASVMYKMYRLTDALEWPMQCCISFTTLGNFNTVMKESPAHTFIYSSKKGKIDDVHTLPWRLDRLQNEIG